MRFLSWVTVELPLMPPELGKFFCISDGPLLSISMEARCRSNLSVTILSALLALLMMARYFSLLDVNVAVNFSDGSRFHLAPNC